MNITIRNGQEYWITFKDDDNKSLAEAIWNNHEQVYIVRTAWGTETRLPETWDVWKYLTGILKAQYVGATFIDYTLNWAKKKRPVPHV